MFQENLWEPRLWLWNRLISFTFKKSILSRVGLAEQDEEDDIYKENLYSK